MSRAGFFWVVMLLWLILGIAANWPFTAWLPVSGNLVLWVLLALLGWKVFGPPLKGD